MGLVAWIVSYPRSGNTFVRALLLNYIMGGPDGAPLSELPRLSIGESDEPLWTELTGQPPEARTFERQWSVRAAYFEAQRARMSGGIGLFKSHTPNVVVFGQPAFDFRPNDKVIHVVRNPFDVAISTAAYRNLSLDEAIELVLSRETIIDARPEGGFEAIGSWAQHAVSWDKGCPVGLHRVRYFELLNDPRGALEAMIRFLGLEVRDARIESAVAACRFERMAGQERSAGFAEATMVQSGRFFRVGRDLQFLDSMTQAQIETLRAPLSGVLEQMGFSRYLAEATRAADAVPQPLMQD
jgi:hypothetical protein